MNNHKPFHSLSTSQNKNFGIHSLMHEVDKKMNGCEFCDTKKHWKNTILIFIFHSLRLRKIHDNINTLEPPVYAFNQPLKCFNPPEFGIQIFVLVQLINIQRLRPTWHLFLVFVGLTPMARYIINSERARSCLVRAGLALAWV